jgi:DNA-binding response OmpR family regulator
VRGAALCASDLILMSSRNLSGVRANVYPDDLREGRPRALVADDDAGIRVLIHRILLRNGFEADTARDGAEAIERIADEDYDVIVLDLMMPRISGFAVAEYLQKHRPELLSRVIVITAFGATGIDKVKHMVDCTIEKPFEVSRLAVRAKAIVAKHHPGAAPEPGSTDDEAGE